MTRATIESRAIEFREARRALDLFDSNLWLGRPVLPESFWAFECMADLVEHLRRCDIRRGIVTHLAAKDYDVKPGNQMLLRALADWPDFYGAAVLTPDMAWSETECRALLADLLRQRVRLVRLFPLTHKFSLSRWSAGPLFDELAARRVPAVIWHTELSWETVDRLCGDYPGLPVIVEGTPQKILYHPRSFYPLFKKHPNLFLEMHSVVGPMAVEDIVAHCGAGHLIYGSYLPFADPNAPAMMIAAARIPEADKAAIAHGNLERLLEAIDLS